VEKKTNACKELEGKSERKTPLGKPRIKWDYNVQFYLKKSHIRKWLSIGFSGGVQNFN
jgi:hypothetical protein